MSRAKVESAEATLARLRDAHLQSVRRVRAKAALVIGGLTLDADHVRALKAVQKALHAPSQAAAVRAAIRFTAEATAKK